MLANKITNIETMAPKTPYFYIKIKFSIIYILQEN